MWQQAAARCSTSELASSAVVTRYPILRSYRLTTRGANTMQHAPCNMQTRLCAPQHLGYRQLTTCCHCITNGGHRLENSATDPARPDHALHAAEQHLKNGPTDTSNSPFLATGRYRAHRQHGSLHATERSSGSPKQQPRSLAGAAQTPERLGMPHTAELAACLCLPPRRGGLRARAACGKQRAQLSAAAPCGIAGRSEFPPGACLIRLPAAAAAPPITPPSVVCVGWRLCGHGGYGRLAGVSLNRLAAALTCGRLLGHSRARVALGRPPRQRR